MRRIIITLLIFVLCAAPYGCAKGRDGTPALTEDDPSEPYSDIRSDAGTENVSADGQTEILGVYLERFGTDVYFRDTIVDFKYFILNGSELVCLLAVPNAEQTSVVPLTSVSRVEQVKAGAFTVVTVYDISGGSVSIDLDDEKAAELVKMIR